jgi:hypothetical protein
MRHQGYLRNYESAIRLLTQRGHQVRLAFHLPENHRDDRLLRQLAREGPLSYGMAPKVAGFWMPLAALIRLMADYTRYLGPDYAGADKLRDRTERRVPRPVRSLLGSRMLRTGHGRRLVGRVLAVVEQAIPPHPAVTAFLRDERPDVVLLTPLLDIGSPQFEYLKAARALELPTGLCVASWDNLTNKGLIRLEPDLVTVWNDAQKSEAIELHGVAPERIVVTGAQCYDKWFDRLPSAPRDVFCRKVGLDPARPFLLYVCSSVFIADGREVEFVERWIGALRSAPDARVREFGVLVRPHPQNAASWCDADLSAHDNVTVYPRAGANPLDEESRDDFFDSMYHSAGVVGINTSAMIEAAIVGRSVFTVPTREFGATQEGTLHFRHLVQGGLLHVAQSLDEHLQQLATAGGDRQAEDRIQKFVEWFVRPHGLATPCTPLLADAVEGLGRRGACPDAGRSPGLTGLRVALTPVAILVRLVERLRKSPPAEDVGRSTRRVVRSGRGAALVRSSVRGANAILKAAGLAEPIKRHLLPELLRATSHPGGSHPLVDEIGRGLESVANGSRRIIVGPWLSEVGFELLYWIPFLRGFVSRFGIPPERLVVVSRGGAEAWYHGLHGQYLDVFDLMSPDEFRAANARRWQAAGGQKQLGIEDLDRLVIDQVRKRLDEPDAAWLHPSLMYNLFYHLWSARLPLHVLLDHTRYQRLPAPADGPAIPGLPKEYVSVRFYFRPSFPDVSGNRAFVARLLARLVRTTDVVVLNPRLRVDDHEDYEVAASGRLHHVDDVMMPRNNLDVQTRIIAGAVRHYGTYGGLSYLGPFLGVPSVGFYSDVDHFEGVHLDVAYRVFRQLGTSFTVLNTVDAEGLGLLVDETGHGTDITPNVEDRA